MRFVFLFSPSYSSPQELLIKFPIFCNIPSEKSREFPWETNSKREGIGYLGVLAITD